jgi:TP901 family phage tail tape measure protein
MPARTITIAGLGDFRQLQSELERTGVIGDKSATTMANSAKRAGLAAAEQAKLVGQSADQQAAAAGRAAAAYEKSQERMSQAAKAASRSAAEAGRAAGLSADQQEAAAKRAAAAQDTHAKISKVGGVVALGAAGLAVEAVKLGMAYQTAQASIQGATGQSVKSTGELTKAFGATAGSSMESGQQMETAYAGVAGQLKLTEGHALSTAEAMKFSAAANNLAEGTGTDLASAYSATAKVLQTFHMDASQAGQVTDTLYGTSKALAVPVEQVATAVSKLHARLGEAAPSLGDTAGLMVALGEHGMTGSRGIMVVNTAFQTLLGGSKKTDDVLKAIGVSVYDSSGKFVGLQSVISQLQPKLAGMTEQQRRFTEATLFGKGATEVLGQVIRAGAPAFDQATAAATRHNAALKAAEAQQKTFKGEMQTLKATVETLGGDLGLILIPKITLLAKGLSEGIQWLEKHKAAAQALAGVIAGVLGAAVTVFAVDKAAAFGKGVAGMARGLRSLATQSSVTAGEVGTADGVMVGETDAAAASMKAALMTTGIGLALVLLGTAAFELEEHWSQVMKALESAAKTAADEIVKALNKIKEAAEIAAEGPLALRRLIPGAGGSVIPNIPEPFGGSGKGGGGAKQEGQTAAERSAASLMNLGIPYNAAQGVVKGLQGETQGNLEKGATEEGKEGAYGIAQWLGSRRAGLEAFAKSKKKPKSNLEVQLEYLAKELKGPEHGTLTALQHAHGVNEASGIFIKKFERPESASAVEQRAAGYASNKALQEQMEEASGAKPKKGTKPKTEPYVAPLTSTVGLRAERTDMGKDYAMKSGNVDAIGAGIVTAITKNWYKGQPYIEYQLTQGARKGQHVYAAEGISPDVTVGERLKAGQRIGTYQEHGTGLEMGFGAGGGKTLAQATTGYTEGQVTPAGQAFAKFIGAIGKGGTVFSSATKASEAAEKAEAKRLTTLESTAKKMLGETTPRGNLESAIQSGTVSTLEKVLGVSTGGKAGSTLPRELARSSGQELTSASLHTIVATLSRGAQGTPTGKTFDKMITELNATHQAGMVKLAARLERAHKEALDDLGRELYAVTQEKQAAMLSNQATELKDRTTQEADYASRQLDIVKATNQQELDAMQSATKQIEDTTVVMRDAFAAAGEAISMQSQLGTEEASGQVMEIKDAATIQVAKLGERGLYGLNLIAQKQEVQLDEMKASYDIEIEHAKIAADHVKIAQAQLLAAKQQEVDLLQAHEDQIAAAEQAQADSVAVQDAINLSAAQSAVDEAQLQGDIAVDLAQLAGVLTATGTKAQQDVAKAFEKSVSGKQGLDLAKAADSLSKAQSAANTAAENAAHAYATAQAEGAQVIASAQEGLEKVKGEGEIAVKNAEAAVSSIEAKAAVAEANLEGKIAVERERAQTQYAGSGLSIEMYGMDYGNAEANVNALTWALTHQLPV